ncbi:NAD(P)-binding domain-containing protein [Nocardia sp. NPDC056000]|uniref:NAD(P)-binding domain-containing protein n=1 Tax=Nocardia sp. NPDC056000 TaxID=3345674 RepID=UPI0035D5B8E4
MSDRPRYDVIVIGAGFAGLCVAIMLRRKGIDNFVILEKAQEVGGTWRENTYPGAACDVMSLMYSFSFAPNPNWTRGYAGQAEILEYLREVTERFDLRRSICFGAEVVSERFDDDSDTWTVTTTDGVERTARVIIAGTGPLHIPQVPDIPGAESFAGNSFHSARWDHSVDVTGRRVAVIGTGASAVQFTPPLAERAAHVDVFQRTPSWVLPKLDRPITAAERAAYRMVPGLRKLVRGGIYFSHEALTGAFLNPKYMPVVRAVAKTQLRQQVRDPELRARLTPEYEIGCKRMVMDNGYYPALQRENVELVTAAITEITETGIRTADGVEHPADVIIYGTGFKVVDKTDDQTLIGANGQTIQQLWRDGPQAYLGLATYGLPNYFLLMGPNTGVGNQSIVFIIEAQARYIVALLAAMRAREATRVEVKSHVQQQFNRDLQRRSRGTVWTTGGCRSWYLDSDGVNRAIWPGSTLDYWRRTRTPRLADFEFTRPEDRDDEDEYHGPAFLSGADDIEYPVRVHLLAVYQPVDNTVHWSGRIDACADLARLHTVTNQTVRLRIPDRDAVPALLTDSDPWGGSHITGSGAFPYTHPLDLDTSAAFGA